MVANGLAINTAGEVSPCCKYSGHFGFVDTLQDINFETLNDVEWPKGCVKCKNNESIGLTSKRQSYNKIYDKNNDYFLDISLGNYCNLKCRMCDENCSTSWHKEAKLLGRDTPPGFNLSKEQIDSIFNKIDTSKKLTIEIKGGEPLMNPNAKFLFTKLKDLNARIILITNGTLLPDWLCEILPDLDIDFAISVDGVNNTYEYVRGDNTFSWEQCLKNIKKVEELIGTVRFNYVVQNYTINDMLNFDSMFEYITWIVLRNPYYLACNIMPDENKEPIKNKLEQLKNCPEGLIDFFMQPCDQKLYRQFIDYSAKLDKFRNQSLLAATPHLVNIEGKTLYESI